jgi:WD40 repeat protein
VLTADFAGRVIAWDCSGETPTPRWNIEAHTSTIYALAVSGDGERIATGDREGVIRVWQANDGQLKHELTGIMHPVYGIAFHPDGRQLISADRRPKKPRVTWWELATGDELSAIAVEQLSAYRRYEDIEWGGIRSITMSPDGGTLVACGSNGYSGPACALLFDVATGELKRKLTSSLKGFCYSATFHAQGFLMTAAGDVAKGEFRAWDLDQDESLSSVSTAGPCTAIDIHPDGSRCIIAQTIGKRSYPDSGTLTLYEWED